MTMFENNLDVQPTLNLFSRVNDMDGNGIGDDKMYAYEQVPDTADFSSITPEDCRNIYKSAISGERYRKTMFVLYDDIRRAILLSFDHGGHSMEYRASRISLDKHGEVSAVYVFIYRDGMQVYETELSPATTNITIPNWMKYKARQMLKGAVS
jgi:hypothetical protein